MCNFLEYKGSFAFPLLTLPLPFLFANMSTTTDSKVIYRRYASLFFVTGIGQQDNELITLELIHRFVSPFPSSSPSCVPVLTYSASTATLRSSTGISAMSANWICALSCLDSVRFPLLILLFCSEQHLQLPESILGASLFPPTPSWHF
jgi:hypothetical protein